MPGFSEIDLVSHAGTSAEGEHIHSLNLTDIHTTWVETAAVLGKGAAGLGRALEELRQALPFRLRGIDSTTAPSSSRAPHKKNWTHVRKLLGYVRYDTPAALTAINDLYRRELRLFQNLFLPSVKLVCKERVGARPPPLRRAPRSAGSVRPGADDRSETRAPLRAGQSPPESPARRARFGKHLTNYDRRRMVTS